MLDAVSFCSVTSLSRKLVSLAAVILFSSRGTFSASSACDDRGDVFGDFFFLLDFAAVDDDDDRGDNDDDDEDLTLLLDERAEAGRGGCWVKAGLLLELVPSSSSDG